MILARRIATPTRIQTTTAGQIESDVVRQFLHAAHVDAARERARRELVRHQRDVATTRATRAEQSPIVIRLPRRLQSLAHEPQGTQRVE